MTQSIPRVRLLTLVALAAVATVLPAGSFPPGPQPQVRAQAPTGNQEARTLIDRYIAAIGGVKAYKSLSNMQVVYDAKTRHDNPAQSSEFRWTITRRADGAIHIKKESRPDVEIYGFDGKDYWRRPPRSRKTVDATATFIKEMKLDAMLQDFLLEYAKLGFDALVSPRHPNRVTFRKRGTTGKKAGEQFDFTFDPDAHTLDEVSMMRLDPKIDAPVRYTVQYRVYQKVGGVLIPKKMLTLRKKKVLIEATVKDVKLGKSFPDSLFKRPS